MNTSRIAVVVLLLLPVTVRGDGGTVRYARDCGPYRVTVFTSPTPFRVGPVDVSLLVQDAKTHEPLEGVRANLHLLPREGGVDVEVLATRAAATNKLYLSAKFELTAAGTYDCKADIDGPAGPARATFTLEAGEKLPPWGDLWLWFAWPIVPIGLFALLVLGKSGNVVRNS
ncbi:MAG: hypothetical protein AB7K24_12415 [Gemmataceae bacterium]